MGSLLFSKTGLLVVIVAVLISLDIKKHGSYKASKTGTFLRTTGAQQVGERAFRNFRTYVQQVYRWARKNVPEYAATTRTNLVPFLINVRDLLWSVALQLWSNLKLLGRYLTDMSAAGAKMVESYAPGLPAKMGDLFGRTCSFVTEHSLKAARLVLLYLTRVAEWIRDNVFIGKMSPENLQRYTMTAVNTTRSLAAQSFTWLNKKIVAISAAS